MASGRTAAGAMQDEHGMARMQELLSSYYGTQDRETQAQSRRDIDAPGFEPATYVKVRAFLLLCMCVWRRGRQC